MNDPFDWEGLPVDVLHAFVGSSATMRVKACSLVPMVRAAGPEMDRAETVTLFNDLCVLAPAALVYAPVTWQAIDDHHARGLHRQCQPGRPGARSHRPRGVRGALRTMARGHPPLKRAAPRRAIAG